MKPALYKALHPYRRLADSRWRRLLERKRQARARSSPPRCPQGWKTGPPDFVGVGAQRAGTTWWNFLIEQHPQVTRRYPKELQYFVGRRDQEIDASDYWRYFARKPGTVVGEWTPSYMFFDWIMRDLAAAAPDAQIIISLRDPVDRYLSAIPLYEDLYMEGLPKLDRDNLLLRGEYGPQIERVYSFFDPDFTSRSLGTYMILEHVDRARRLGLAYVYLGYWVMGSSKMDYKSRFLPQERLLRDGWTLVGGA